MRLRGPAGQPIADYIAEVAADLFYRDGVHAVGVDRVADTAGLTKRTIYRHFRSKDELIAASLRRAPRVRFPSSGAPAERILGAFALLEQFLAGTKYRGCPYIIYTAELTDPGHPARRLIETYIAKRRAWFRDRAAEAGVSDPETVAEELDLLFDGALASGAKRGNLVAAQTAQRMARLVLNAAVPARAPVVAA
ncbi:MAG TPA: TetR family transcriptional regulator [Candidatus Elarobacter sp.]|jgi:AcrR family transcriptional regulator|nr:TetR family transcriptional regulator [Candidatus Elarobacter sp.]